ncbi:outer membrane protein assembly factor BamD [Oryzomonas japonica]|uniref:Outer membrane protein assembly factor BamD n=1 Tax=Oryzomonas japonica TaxID=2603858 RepID=A0A7J4ZND3_9BACT|nr:outer membrane protein assembly factor BamD [Oryzomonas japonica]KAB0664219.1 outer membrane protein assembly factor BamD [Oryzomonas japonica]
MRRSPITSLIIPTLALFLLLAGALCAPAAELDDSNLFVEAFNAYQKKDYLLTIDKVKQLTQVFPDTPLKDVSLLLLARSSLKSGDNALAARTVNQFLSEFPATPLRSSIEDDLLTLGARLHKGEKLTENRALHMAAVKVRNEQLAIERAIAERQEQERLARLKTEQERIAREKAELERRERERIAAEKAAKETIRTATAVTVEQSRIAQAGQNGTLPFEIANRTGNSEEYLLEVDAPAEYGAQLSAETTPGAAPGRVTVGAGQSFKGAISFHIPSDRVDGERKSMSLKAVSARFSDVALTKETLVTITAPLVRVVARPASQSIVPGGQVRYRMTVLNIGSQTAQELTGRLILPPQFEFPEAENPQFHREGADVLSFKIDPLETGKMSEYYLNLRVRDDSAIGQEVRYRVEVFNGQLQRKETFASSAAVVQGK